ncbi:MAG: plastocyanin/azurin family copper-binding protein, partial [Dehalococcoidia bacterium]
MKYSMSIVGVIAAAGLLAAACGGGSSDKTSTPGASSSSDKTATEVAVTEKEWSVVPASASVPAGEVHFTVKNTGATAHEFVVIKATDDPAKLPTYQASDKVAEGHAVGDVNEDKVDSVGELEDLAAGSSKDGTFKLSAGKYVLICNLPAHY